MHNIKKYDKIFRIVAGILIILISSYYGCVIGAIIGIILSSTGFSGYCFLYEKLNINKNLDMQEYYLSMLPKYNPEPVFIFGKDKNLIFQNEASKNILPNIKSLNNITELNILETIKDEQTHGFTYSENDKTYLLAIRGVKELNYLMVYGFNITELKIKEALLAKQSQKALLGDMIDIIAHQWMQPLTVINLLVMTMQMNYELNEKFEKEHVDKFSQDISLQVNHLKETLNEFRSFFRPNKEIVKFNLADSINSILAIVKGDLDKNKIEIDKNIDNNLYLFGYPNEFKHILLNLISNSKDAFNEHNIKDRKIKIESYKKDENVFILVKDNAGGIPEEILPNIFKLNFTTKGEGSGTGVGLHISKMIVNDINGKIEVKNIILNDKKGVEFKITIPIS